MIRYLLGRLALAAALLLLVITCCFGLVSLIPGDPAQAILGEFASREQIASVHHQLGLDQPLIARWYHYVTHVLRGDLGKSYFTGSSVGHDLLVRLPNSLVIVIPGVALALLLGVVIGTASAYRRGRLLDKALSLFTSATLAVPEFALALVLIYVFFQKLHLSPAPLGMLSPLDVPPPQHTGSVIIDAVISGDWSTLWSVARHAVLPVVCLGIFFSAFFARVVRTGLTASLRSPQVEFARACGLSERQVYRYAMADIRRTLLTYVVILFGAALSGAVILETVFSWPGMGAWAVNGILRNDVPVIQGFVFVIASTLLLSYVVIDVIITLTDPRVRLQTIKSRAGKVTDGTIATPPLEVELPVA